MPTNGRSEGRGFLTRAVQSAVSAAVAGYYAPTGRSSAQTRDALAAGGITLAGKLAQRHARNKSAASKNVSKASNTVLASAKGFSSRLAPLAIGSTVVAGRPRMTGSRLRGQRVIHRELVVPAGTGTSVTGASSFNVAYTFPLQPGLAELLPWGSTVASQYEQYHINSMVFHWVPFISTSTPGSIMMMVDYNPADLPPATETQFMDHAGATTSAAWESLSFKCDVSQMHALGPKKYIRACAVAGDIKTYDSGTFYLAVDNGTAVPWGKLYVEYDIEFFIPQLQPATYGAPNRTSYYNSTTVAQTFTSTVNTALGFDPLNGDPLSIGPAAAHIFTPPAGFYRVEASVVFKDTAAETFVANMFLVKNSVAYPNATAVFIANGAGVANQYLPVNAVWFVACSGTDTIGITANLTGAAGTLSLQTLTVSISLA